MADVRSLPVTAELVDYAVAHSSWPIDDVVAELQADTRALTGGAAGMQIGPDQGALLTLLTRLVGARRAIELGTFTGYSALCIARGLADGGTLLCCDVSEEWTAIARQAWARAELDDRIELRLGPALDTLRGLPTDEHLDLVFIDADKVGYVDYWRELVPRVRSGGVLLADNVLYSGRVVDPATSESTVQAMQAFNEVVATDGRVEVVVLPAFDGLTIARKR
jgi:caffeoyl-CoA O-methyltransferase